MFDCDLNTTQGSAAILTQHDKMIFEYANSGNTSLPGAQRKWFHGGVKYFIFHIKYNGVERTVTTSDPVSFIDVGTYTVFTIQPYFGVIKRLWVAWYSQGWITN